MIEVLGTNIISALGKNSRENVLAVKRGISALERHENTPNVPYPFTASTITDVRKDNVCTPFEAMVISSVEDALANLKKEILPGRTLFVLCTTKANIDRLCIDGGVYYRPGESAERIGRGFGFKDTIVVCNACISGVSGQVLADRMISMGAYDYVVVSGADTVNDFTLAGFMSFKSLDPAPCKPFDIERLGLNLGEAASTIIFGKASETENGWKLCRWSLTNDAYHQSAPAPDGEGLKRAITRAIAGIEPESLETVCVHGTATMFNDQMESKALSAVGLGNVPITALKGYLGHTLGSSGIVETILTMEALDEGFVPGAKNFSELGVSGKLNICEHNREAGKGAFLKIISGFGGCNGAVLYSRKATAAMNAEAPRYEVRKSVKIGPEDDLKEICKAIGSYYPRIHKMDVLAKLLTAGYHKLMEGEETVAENTAMVLFCKNSSIVTDKKHIQSFKGEDGFYPSPSIFLYTLPNEAMAEVAIKHGIKGETTMYIMDSKNEEMMDRVFKATMTALEVSDLICGWLDYPEDGNYEMEIKHIKVKR